MPSNAAKNFDIPPTNLNVPYIIILIKLFSDLHLELKFLDTSTKSFFPCRLPV